MSYAKHLSALLDAHFEAHPRQSPRSLSLSAGLHSNWVLDFRRRGVAQVRAMEAMAKAIAKACPEGAEGDAIRELLEVFEPTDPSGAQSGSEEAA